MKATVLLEFEVGELAGDAFCDDESEPCPPVAVTGDEFGGGGASVEDFEEDVEVVGTCGELEEVDGLSDAGAREVDDEVVGTLIWVLDVEEAVVVDTLLVVGSVVVLEGSSVDVEELSDVEVEGVDESVVVDFA